MSTAALETYVDLNRNRLETMLKVLDVDGAVRRVRGGWESTGQPWAYDEERYRRVQRGPRARAAGDARLPRDRPAAGCASCATSSTTPSAADCGRCDNCGGLDLSTDVSETAASRRPRPGWRGPASWSSRARCGRPRWPTSASTSRARSARRRREGRAVARLTDLGYGQALRELFAPATPDGPVPVPLVRAVVEVLGDWRPPVDGIVVVESATRPTAHRRPRRRPVALPRRCRSSAATRSSTPTSPRARAPANSAQRVAAVGRRYDLQADVPSSGQRILLVDDRVGTGWTLTLAAAR